MPGKLRDEMSWWCGWRRLGEVLWVTCRLVNVAFGLFGVSIGHGRSLGNVCTSISDNCILRRHDLFFSFVYSYSHTVLLGHGGAPFIQVSRPCPRESAHCKLPFALHPGLSQENKTRTKEIIKERRDPDKMKNK